MEVQLPAVVGILTASQPPRYVPVSRIRAAAQQTRFEMVEGPRELKEPSAAIRRVYLTPATAHATMLRGSEEEVARQLVEILLEKGILK
jgi:electron transfer flavoprotein beta subunit